MSDIEGMSVEDLCTMVALKEKLAKQRGAGGTDSAKSLRQLKSRILAQMQVDGHTAMHCGDKFLLVVKYSHQTTITPECVSTALQSITEELLHTSRVVLAKRHAKKKSSVERINGTSPAAVLAHAVAERLRAQVCTPRYRLQLADKPRKRDHIRPFTEGTVAEAEAEGDSDSVAALRSQHEAAMCADQMAVHAQTRREKRTRTQPLKRKLSELSRKCCASIPIQSGASGAVTRRLPPAPGHGHAGSDQPDARAAEMADDQRLEEDGERVEQQEDGHQGVDGEQQGEGGGWEAGEAGASMSGSPPGTPDGSVMSVDRSSTASIRVGVEDMRVDEAPRPVTPEGAPAADDDDDAFSDHDGSDNEREVMLKRRRVATTPPRLTVPMAQKLIQSTAVRLGVPVNKICTTSFEREFCVSTKFDDFRTAVTSELAMVIAHKPVVERLTCVVDGRVV